VTMNDLFKIKATKGTERVCIYRGDLAEAFRMRDRLEALGWSARVAYNRVLEPVGEVQS